MQMNITVRYSNPTLDTFREVRRITGTLVSSDIVCLEVLSMARTLVRTTRASEVKNEVPCLRPLTMSVLVTWPLCRSTWCT